MATRRRRADRLDGHRHAHRRAVGPARGCCSTTSSSCSPRSPTRRSTPSARSWSRRSSATDRPRGQPARRRGPSRCRQIVLPFPIITTTSWPSCSTSTRTATPPGFKAFAIDGLYPVGRRRARRCAAALDDDLRQGQPRPSPTAPTLIVLSDRNSDRRAGADPVAAADRAVHHHLIREKTRTKVGLVVETGEAREVHHMALLRLRRGGHQPVPGLRDHRGPDRPAASSRGVTHRKAVPELHQGLRQGRAQGHVEDGHLDRRVLHRRPGVRGHRPVARTSSTSTSPAPRRRLGGIGLDVHRRRGRRPPPPRLPGPARPSWPTASSTVGGEYQWRREGEYHLFNPETVFKLQHATRTKRYEIFKEYTRAGRRPGRSAWRRCAACSRFTAGDAAGRCRSTRSSRSSTIVKRFSTGAMSYGSISAEAHETLAIAMNRIGGQSNTGEGGEDADRFIPDANGDLAPQRRQAGGVGPLRRDVASTWSTPTTSRSRWPRAPSRARAASCPGHKVYPWIAKTRHSTPGVGLISPAAAPRHLLDRGPRPAHPRPEERQHRGPGPRQAGRRGRASARWPPACPRPTPTSC